MVQTKKYKAYGVRRANNLSDILDAKESLNNLLNNISGVDPSAGITFISEDLDSIRGLKDTDIGPSDFTQLAGSTPITYRVDELGNSVPDSSGSPFLTVINPLIRIQDRFKLYRNVTEDPPVFASGRGPRAYFIPSALLPGSFAKGSDISTQLESNLTDPTVKISDDFWVLGEFYINDRIDLEFPDEYGGIMWEGYYIPNPSTTIHTFSYETSGLFHVEFDRFGNGTWEVLKSIYAKVRSVLVQTATTSTVITLQAGETKYVSVGDFLTTDNTISITGVSATAISLSAPITVTAGQTLTFDMPIGSGNVSAFYSINEILDRAETPQMKKRIFWWFPNTGNYFPDVKYLRNVISGQTTYDYFYLNSELASPTAAAGSVRELLDTAITPVQDVFDYQFKSRKTTTTLFTPKPFLNQITKGTSVITFQQGTRSATGIFSTTEVGNYIIPTAVADLGPVIPKGTRLKDLLNGDIDSTARLVNVVWPATRTDNPITFIDHVGLVDYFVVTSAGDVNTILSSSGTTATLKKDMYCVFDNTNQFIRITEIISPTSFRTSVALNLTNSYVYIYANAGIIDRSLDVFCVSVFGQVVAAQAALGATTIQLESTTGVANGMIVQFGDSIPPATTVLSFTATTVTLSNPLASTINASETIIFAPAGTNVNKEICVRPIDISPPFVGVDTGLDTANKGIRSSQPVLNVKFEALTINGPASDPASIVSTVDLIENYDSRIDLFNSNFSIIAKKIV